MIDTNQMRRILCSVLKSEEPMGWAEDFDLRNGAVDSLDMVSFALKLEEASGIHVPDSDFERMRTFKDVRQVLEEVRQREADAP